MWPLLLYALWRLGGALAVRVGAVAGLLASTTLMAWIAISDGIPVVTDSGRVYFGTDTHAMTLLVGAVLATYWPQRDAVVAFTPQARRTVAGIGLASLVGLVAAFWFVEPMSWALYRGGFLWVGLLTAGVVAAGGVNGTGFARALSVQPLRWIGQRSYGIYLWHWPIFMVLRPGADLETRGWPVEVARFGLTLLAAALSYRYVEMPVRRGAVGRVWAGLDEPSGPGSLTRRHLAVVGTVCTVIALGAGLSAVREPALPDELRALAPVGTGPLTDADGAAGPGSSGPAAARPRTSRSPRAVPPAPLPAGRGRHEVGTSSITAVGDSVMLAASAALDTQIPEVTVDAAVSRQPEVIFDRIRERKRLGRLGDVVVIGAGTNGRIRSADLTSILDLLKGRVRVVLVTCHADRSWTSQSNAAIRSAGRRFATGNVVVVDWDTYAARHPRLLYGDGIHPRPGAGSRAYARLIRAAINQ